jgi:hypothetical protein
MARLGGIDGVARNGAAMGDHAGAASRSGSRLRDRRLVLLLAVAVLAVGLLWWVAPWHGASPVIMTGTAHPNGEATAIGFTPDSRVQAWRWGVSQDGEGFVIAGVEWTDAAGTWRQGPPPSCLSDGMAAPVELRFVRVNDDEGPTRVVTMLRCLS